VPVTTLGTLQIKDDSNRKNLMLSFHILKNISFLMEGSLKIQNSFCVVRVSGSSVTVAQGIINYIDTKAKCRHLKVLTRKETLRQVFVRV
jgi:hypothetical protein